MHLALTEAAAGQWPAMGAKALQALCLQRGVWNMSTVAATANAQKRSFRLRVMLPHIKFPARESLEEAVMLLVLVIRVLKVLKVLPCSSTQGLAG